jgi:hypothetical protein
MTDEPQLPEGVTSFVLKYVDSIAELEALLLVRSTELRPWAVRDLVQRLYITEGEATEVVRALHRRGLLSQEGETFRYEPRSDALRRDVDALAAAYPRFLIPLTRLVHGKPPASLRNFADAFRLREEK